MSPPRLMICPFCGHTQRPAERCQDCGTAFDAAARKATIARMGPWFVRDPERSFLPGCTSEALRALVAEGRVGRYTIVRGPTTRQLWTVARHVPGLAHLLGYCHACDAPVSPEDQGCHHCGATFTAHEDRDSLGLLDEDGPPRPAAQGRSVGYVPGPARGISAFASDEELLAPGGTRATGVGALAARAPMVSESSAAPAIGGSGDGASTGRGGAGEMAIDADQGRFALHASIERSLRTSLRRQRLLSALLLGVVIALFAAGAWLFMRVRILETAGAAPHGAVDAHTGPKPEAPSTSPAPAAPPASSGPIEGSATDKAPASAESLAQELEALAADRAGDPDERRARLAAVESALAATSGMAADRMESLRQRIEAVRAQIELDAVLPPQPRERTPG